jgi:two-component system, cell cycle sensor histidine kinase and response regulator CckA
VARDCVASRSAAGRKHSAAFSASGASTPGGCRTVSLRGAVVLVGLVAWLTAACPASCAASTLAPAARVTALATIGVLGLALLWLVGYRMGRQQHALLSTSLARSEERYRRMVEIANEGIWTLDADLRATFVNAKLAERLGYAPEEMLRLPVTAFMFPDDYADHAVQVRARRDGQRGTYERRLLCRDGSTRWMVVAETPVFESDGRFAGLLAMLTDITERKRAEQNLRASESRLRAIVETAIEAIVTVDEERRVDSLNPAAERIFGWPAGAAVGRPAAELIPLIGTLAQSVIDTPRETEGHRRDGTVVPLNFTMSEFAVGGTRERTLMIRDLTEQKKAEGELEAARAQLAQAQRMEAIGRLASGVAHDFNNLLSIINGFGEMARRALDDDHPVQRRLETMLRAAEKGAALTRQLLAFGRGQTLAPRNLRLDTVVAGFEGMLRRAIGEDVRLSTQFAPELDTVHVDPGQIEQVLLNLVVNARDAMPQGGELTIETTSQEVAPASHWERAGARPGRYVRLSVRDTGHGMDEAVRAKIFEPFFTTKPTGQGTGLGLAMVYGIVTQSGGHVHVESRPGQGTRFDVLLPSGPPGDERVATAPRQPPASSTPGGGETVLVVEDDETLREIIVESLAACGYQILAAANGVEALDVASRVTGRIDLLLTDIVMPQMNGKALADRLGPSHAEMRVLFMSGYADDTIERYEVTGEGMAFLQKPFTAETLARQVRSMLDTIGTSA